MRTHSGLATVMLTAGVVAAASAAPGLAGAAPAVSFKAKPAAIKKFKGTGNHLGAGAEIKLELGTIPGAPYMSTTRLDFALGSALEEGETAHYYVTLPKQCPASGRFSYEAELAFQEYEGAPRQTVTTEYEAKCPKK
jgi:hypothetical protein